METIYQLTHKISLAFTSSACSWFVVCLFVLIVESSTAISLSATGCTETSCLPGQGAVGMDIVRAIDLVAELNHGVISTCVPIPSNHARLSTNIKKLITLEEYKK